MAQAVEVAAQVPLHDPEAPSCRTRRVSLPRPNRSAGGCPVTPAVRQRPRGGVTSRHEVHVWINGAFGVGKSSTADHLVGLRPACRHFDAEQVGYMLIANLKGVVLRDFQDLPAWRRLVPAVVQEVAEYTSDRLVVVQSVMNRDYWNELAAGLEVHGMPIVHVLLDADAATLRHRIEHDEVTQAKIAAGTIDPAGVQWRLEHIETYLAARDWLTEEADLVVDTGSSDVGGVANKILAGLPDAWGHRPSAAPSG